MIRNAGSPPAEAALAPSGLARIVQDKAAWINTADAVAILIAVALPVSTSAVEILAGVFVAALLPTIDGKALVRLLKRPVCFLPLALFGLAVIGMIWSDASWTARFGSMRSVMKLIMLPLLLYHFTRSARGSYVFIAFLAASVFVMLWSFVVTVEPQLAFKRANSTYGVPVKDYIDQSQEFALCLFAALGRAVFLVRSGRWPLAVLLVLAACGFLASLAFVTIARTAFVYMPVMLLVLALFCFSWRVAFGLVAAAAIVGVALWVVSPNLQAKVNSIFAEYNQYEGADAVNSVGLRLEFWRKSLKFISEAPIIGHGTGSTRGLFERDAMNQRLVHAEVISNPHNQTLNVAVQWGIVGVVLLYALWLFHLLLFRGESFAAWIGTLVVVQNVVSSLFNSHLFDFHEGWMYVLGVGVAGGMVLQQAMRNVQPSGAA